MSKPLWLVLAAALLTCAGCFTPPVNVAPETTAAPPQALPPALPPVRADQVTEENAYEMLDKLGKEIDREAQKNMLNTASR